MANNDMEVIEYKILKYLYECLKSGHRAVLEEIAWRCKLFEITREYWLVIMQDLIENGFVSGLKYVSAKDMECVIETGTFAITRKGREYLLQNSLMKKAENMLGEVFKITLGGVIGML